MACGTNDGSVYVLDHCTSEVKHRLVGVRSAVTCLQFVDEFTLLSGHADGKLALWNANGWLCLGVE